MIQIGGHLVYVVFLVLEGGLLLLSLSHLYHAIRFGGTDPISVAATGIFIAGIIAIVWMTLFLLGSVNWGHSFSVSLPSIPSVHFGLPSQ